MITTYSQINGSPHCYYCDPECKCGDVKGCVLNDLCTLACHDDMVKKFRERQGAGTVPHNSPAKDLINHPQHYTSGKIEVIDVIEDWNLGFCTGNAVKYIGRHNHKGTPRQDIEKAIWYLQRYLKSIQ